MEDRTLHIVCVCCCVMRTINGNACAEIFNQFEYCFWFTIWIHIRIICLPFRSDCGWLAFDWLKWKLIIPSTHCFMMFKWSYGVVANFPIDNCRLFIDDVQSQLSDFYTDENSTRPMREGFDINHCHFRMYIICLPLSLLIGHCGLKGNIASYNIDTER